MTQAIVYQRTNHACPGCARVPDAASVVRSVEFSKTREQYSPQTERLLVFVIPASNDQHKHGRDTRFQKSKQKPNSIESLVVMASGRRHLASTPDKDHKCCNTLDWVPLSQKDRWIGAGNKTKIIDGSRKRIPVASLETEVCSKTE
jgi:hypothetical protein